MSEKVVAWVAWVALAGVLACVTDGAQAQVFTLNEDAKLTASDAAADDESGRSVSVSGDAAVVGSYVLEPEHGRLVL